MSDNADDWGERAATEDEVDDWVSMVRAGRTSGYRNRPLLRDRIRPTYGAGQASSEGDEE